MKPAFSVVTITYNRAHLIGETIQSVLNQTYQNFEHIIIDDGSTDNTEQVINSFDDKRIKYFKYKKNGLRSFLRNEGVKKSNGKFVSILDSDDIWREDKLQLVKDILIKNKKLAFIIHNVSFVENNINQNIGYLNYKNDFNKNILNDLFSDTILAYPIYTFRKKLMENIGYFDENMIDGQQDFYLRVASKFNIFFIAQNLTFMKKHEGNISKNIRISALTNYLISIKKLKKANLISKVTFKRMKSIIYFKLGYSFKKLNNKKESKKYFLKGFKINPLSYNSLKSIYFYIN